MQPLPDFLLIAVDQRTIEMAVAEFQRLLDDARTDTAVELPGAEPDRRNIRAVCFNRLHVDSLLHIPLRGLRRIDDASIRAAQAGDLIHLIRAEGEVQHVEVLLLPLRLAGARDDNNAPLGEP